MSHFNLALAHVLENEGGFVDHKNDKGGATNKGISLRFLANLPVSAGDVNGDGHVNRQDVIALTDATIAGFYQDYFWSHYRLDEIEHASVAIKSMDLFVNMRSKTAALITQRAANDLGCKLVEDGVLGSVSIKTLNQLDPESLLGCMRYQAWNVYRAIVAHDKSQVTFINGWRKRAFT